MKTNFIYLFLTLLLVSCDSQEQDGGKYTQVITRDGQALYGNKYEINYLEDYNILYNVSYIIKIKKNAIEKVNKINEIPLVYIDSTLYDKGYKQGQVDMLNGKQLYKLVLQDNGEVTFEKISE